MADDPKPAQPDAVAQADAAAINSLMYRQPHGSEPYGRFAVHVFRICRELREFSTEQAYSAAVHVADMVFGFVNNETKQAAQAEAEQRDVARQAGDSGDGDDAADQGADSGPVEIIGLNGFHTFSQHPEINIGPLRAQLPAHLTMMLMSQAHEDPALGVEIDPDEIARKAVNTSESMFARLFACMDAGPPKTEFERDRERAK